MQKLIIVAFAALCLIGTSSLALADDAMMGEMGNMKDEMKADQDAMKGDMKAKKEEMKAKRHEMKDKMKAHKDAAKAKGEGAKGSAQSMGQGMETAVPEAPVPAAVP